MATQISAILLNISNIVYYTHVDEEYCWIWLQQAHNYVEICLNFCHWNAHALITAEALSTFFMTKFYLNIITMVS